MLGGVEAHFGAHIEFHHGVERILRIQVLQARDDAVIQVKQLIVGSLVKFNHQGINPIAVGFAQTGLSRAAASALQPVSPGESRHVAIHL